MGTLAAAEIDAWLRGGGQVITASERAARSFAAGFHRARRAEGLSAWPAPGIQPWNAFVRAAWQARSLDGRLILNPAQEQSLWAGILAADKQSATLLEGPRHRMARMAMEAHALLCAYAPAFLHERARTAWQQDAAAFSGWLAVFDEICSDRNLLSAARLPLELLPLLENRSSETMQDLPPLVLAGFDRMQPTQRRLLDAWGEWREATHGETSAQTRFYEARDAQSELEACALWCSQRLSAHPGARLLVVTQDAAARRGEIERAFLRHIHSDSLPLFEFSLGVPLGQIPLAKSAWLLLRWLSTTLDAHELDWLFAAGYTAGPQESSALQAFMRALRRRDLQQPGWTLADFLARDSNSEALPAAWVARITRAQRRLADAAGRPQSPLDWAEQVTHLLETAGWPGSRPLSSAEYQAARRFHQAVETAGSLGFDGRRIPWSEFLSALADLLDDSLFAPESRDAPIQIAGPAESAGLTADAIWFLGAAEDTWPASAPTHPLLPLAAQRRAAMPHASPQLDWELARSMTVRLLASAPAVHFSFARQIEALESRPSRLILSLAGPTQALPPELLGTPTPAPLTVNFEDASRIPFPPGKVEGGAHVLTAQSRCPFQAFATARLAALAWEPAQPSLTPAQRGQLLHDALHAIWAGPPDGIRTLHDLQNLPDHPSFVAKHVGRVLKERLRPQLRARLPRRYLELEELRLTHLISEWLDYESARIDFEVVETEAARTLHLGGLTLDLRLDRIDWLNDGTLLVIDYKSGEVTPKSWDLPRPDDVQLPLYAGFALDPGAELGGLTFAKVRPGSLCFAGHIGDARATLMADLHPASALVKDALTAEQLIDWRDSIAQLARDFLAGRAEADPRDPPKTCERCGLQTLCRIHENQVFSEDEDARDGEDPADE